MFLNNPPWIQSRDPGPMQISAKTIDLDKMIPVPSRCDAGLNDKSYTSYPLKCYVNPYLLIQSQLWAVMRVQPMSGWTGPGANKAVTEIWPDWPQSCLSPPYLPPQGHEHECCFFTVGSSSVEFNPSHSSKPLDSVVRYFHRDGWENILAWAARWGSG